MGPQGASEQPSAHSPAGVHTETGLVKSCIAKHAFNYRIKRVRLDIHRGIRSSAKISAVDVIGSRFSPFKLTRFGRPHILSSRLVSTGDFSKGVPMPNAAIPHHMDSALERGLQGRGIARKDALSLMQEAPLETLLQTAAAVRDRFKGNSVSYSRKVFIPLTHLCRDYCGYCT